MPSSTRASTRRGHRRSCETDHSAHPLLGGGHRPRSFPKVIWHAEKPILRTAPAPMFLLSQLVRDSGYKVVLTGEGVGRDARRLRHLQGSQDPAVLGRQARARRMRPLLLQAPLSVHARTSRRSRMPTCEAFFRVGRRTARDPFFSHLPRWQLTARLKLLFSADVHVAAGQLRRDMPSSGRRCRRLSRAGTGFRRRSTSKPRYCCPATSCRRRAIAWHGALAWKGVSRSSITASWSSPRRFRRA